ncbi:MAG: YbaB/EbfC family nucleoid-associated protein [Cyclobacteriaceae bacterium]|nr:YbaB/EbfC family nucleoid-associated protein [Cyclobacteriaceae bacterium]
MMDMAKMLGKMKEVQAKLKETQDNLENLTTTAESGAGMVRATVNGKKKLLKLEIDRDIIQPEDKQMLEDLVVAAVNKAMAEAESMAAEEIKKTTSGMIPNIPGMDFGNMV